MPTSGSPIALWELVAGDGPEPARPPDARAIVLSEREGVMGVQLVDGALPGARSVLWLEAHGPCAILRREEWPPVSGAARASEPRVVLTLKLLAATTSPERV